eukprot:GHVL01037849.1.p1 GENE.GHVL01037849.1~~GHVL01037849.1.p1  ORF type:complete len:217 (+),score=51.00 GHVL01037849.1:35-685(+)
MVFFFKCSDERFVVYMGRDKFENEKLIEFGWPEDIWFHVDKMSSAHVYLRRPEGSGDDVEIPDSVLQEMCQLVKENSIEGCKTKAVDIIYTCWSNLLKNDSMDVGQVSFHKKAKKTLIKAVEKDKDKLKKILSTKVESDPDFQKLRQDRDAREIVQQKKKRQKEMQVQKELDKERMQNEKLKCFESIHANIWETDTNHLRGNGTIEDCQAAEDDFM